MAGQEDLHVGFTRNRAPAKMFVESIDVLREIAGRSQREGPSAVRLEPAAGQVKMSNLKKLEHPGSVLAHAIDGNVKMPERKGYRFIRDMDDPRALRLGQRQVSENQQSRRRR